MWRFRWPAVLVAWLTAIIGVAIVFRIPDQYEATARVYVDTQSILKPLMAGLAVQPNVQQQVEMLSRTLVSRPNVEKVVRMADLDLKSESKADQEALVTRLMADLQIRVGRTRQPVHTRFPRFRPGESSACHPVDRFDLRGVESRRIAQGH